jgi:hypothetical protein
LSALQLLLDERAIERTLTAYTHAIDYGREEELVECFTEDGVLEIDSGIANERVGPTDSGSRRIEGRDAIRDFARHHTRPPEAYLKHLRSDPLIEVDGDRARVTSTFLQLDESAAGPVVTSFGRYHDQLVRCDDGRWRLEHRVAQLESRVASRLAFRIRPPR